MAHERIVSNPRVMFGKPVIRGTRIPLETILRWLGNGASAEQLMSDDVELLELSVMQDRVLPSGGIVLIQIDKMREPIEEIAKAVGNIARCPL